MKSLLLLMSSFLIISAKAQMKVNVVQSKIYTVGQAKNLGVLRGELTYTIDGTDTLYTFSFIDNSYKQIITFKNISFRGGENVEAFYKVIKSFFSDENKKNKDYAVSLTLGDHTVEILNHRELGKTYAYISVGSAHAMYSEKEIDKLFGKYKEED